MAAEAARRRDEHRGTGAAALARMRERGETIAAIAAMAETTESEVRRYLKLGAGVQRQGAAATRRSRRMH